MAFFFVYQVCYRILFFLFGVWQKKGSFASVSSFIFSPVELSACHLTVVGKRCNLLIKVAPCVCITWCISLSIISIWARLVLRSSEVEGGKGALTGLLEGCFQSIDFMVCTNR